jgi:parallel beta-helix repeat protein
VNKNDPVVTFILLSVVIVGLSVIVFGGLWSSGSPSPQETAYNDEISPGSDSVFDPFGIISMLKENPLIKKLIELFGPPEEEPGVETPVPTVPPTSPAIPKPTTPALPASVFVSIEGDTVVARNAAGDLIQSGKAGIDDASVIQTAVDTAPDGGVVEIREGTYAITSKISSRKSVSIRGVGMPTLESSVKASALSFCGPKGDVFRFGGDPAAGDDSINVVGASAIQPGDLVLIYDDTIWNPNDAGGYQKMKAGELHRVLNVNGNTVILEDPLVNSYSSSKNGAVQHIVPITVKIEGIRLTGPDNTADYSGISIGYAVDSRISNCSIENTGMRAIYIRDCYGTTVANNKIQGCERAGYGYGVCIHCSSAYTWVVNNEIDLCRHTICHGALSATPGVPRESHIENNYLRATISHTVDAHPCAESMYIENNELFNTDPDHSLINSGAKLTVIRGNTFSGANGIIKRGAVEGCTFIISDNTFEDVSTCVNTKGDGSVAYLEFTDNICNNVQDHMCRIHNTEEILITGNTCDGASDDGAIYVEKAEKGTIEGNTLNNCHTYCIKLLDSNGISILDNVCTNANRCGDDSKENVPICLNNSLNILVENNRCYDDKSVESAYWIAEVGSSNNNIIRNNMFKGEALEGTIHTIGQSTIVENNKVLSA